MKRTPTPDPEKILFLALSGIGNYIMQASTIASVRQAWPHAHITVWVAPRGTKPLADNDPNVDEVIQMPIKASVSQHIAQINELRKRRFDVGIILSPGQLVKSAAYAFLAGIPTRIGNQYPLYGNQQSAFLLTSAVLEKDDLHDVEQNLRLLEPLGISPALTNEHVVLISDEDKKSAVEIIRGSHIPSGKPIIGFHAGSAPDLAFKRWPLTRFADVASSLIRNHDAHIMLFGGPDEEKQKKELQSLIASKLPQNTGQLPVTIISAPLLTTAAVMQHCRLIISNDSGLMHLASSVGVETIGLFGPTSEGRTGPRGSRSHVIRAQGTTPVYHTETNFELGTEPHETILAISPDQVIKEISLLLE